MRPSYIKDGCYPISNNPGREGSPSLLQPNERTPCILKAMREWRLLPYIIYNQHGEAAR
ncbi:hypothetical protein BACUNI_02804 [Bacteroides uniformis ATCC 8492]|jgi:hypothetical protein|uniref:Uncharacterized protein n=1 Tax=Bacteroides uniformis (strain ATCC 8492 / DSM 6597 / CCUG 4942 / CIP 103695 / JCM 5828 / KCTC 5204 / NCTC 13054 / VPI 0061) TaxID=411479 RepID=A0ABC9N9Y6_BACUC|nr:hypothetical protein BACUNI_02804 [Bacteroides uniformis ATCC 8492]